jgi:hypothetical protein
MAASDDIRRRARVRTHLLKARSLIPAPAAVRSAPMHGTATIAAAPNAIVAACTIAIAT